MEAGPPRSRRRVLGILLAAVVLVAVAGIAYSLLRGGELRTKTGLPLYYGASVTSAGGVEENLSGQGAEVEAYRVRAPAEEVYSWTEAKMAEEGWTKEGSERGGEVWFQYWRKGETMVVVAVGPGVRLGLGGENFVMYISGPYASLGSVELKPIVAPPSVSTLQATGVLSDRATLNASVSRGGYGSVRIRFWWRKAGENWRSTPWENCSSSSYSFDLSGLEPGTLYEFRACVGFDGGEDNGAVLDFRTATPQPSVLFSGLLSLENVEVGMSEIVIKHVYGDRATDAVERTATGWQWKNLELRVNGVVQGSIIRVISEGRDVTSGPVGVYSLVVGDLVRVRLGSPLQIGNKVSLKWVPTNQTLVEKEVTY